MPQQKNKQKRKAPDLEKQARRILGEQKATPSGGGGAGIAARNDQLPDLIFDPSTLGTALPGFFKHPGTQKNVDRAALMKSFPGLMLPGDEGFAPGEVTFRQGPDGQFFLVPAEPTTTTTAPPNPLLPKFASGGNIPGPHVNVVGQTIDAIQGINPDTSRVTQVADQLQGFNPNIQAQTGAMDATAGQLGQFNPLQGTPAGNTLQGMIQTGNAVDVDPITQAAQIRAQQGFNDFLGQTNEQFGALGLGSSSAKSAMQAREAGRLQGGIAAQGLEAGVGAQEAARQRQLQAFNPLLQGSGQQLSGLQSAGQLQGQSAGLNLQGQTAQGAQRLQGLQSAGNLQADAAGLNLQGQMGKAGQFNQLSGNLIPPTTQVNQQPMPQGGGGFGGGGFGGGGFNNQGSAATRGMGIGAQNFNRGFARGGRVDLGDFLGNLTFGQRFTRPEPRDQQRQQRQQFSQQPGFIPRRAPRQGPIMPMGGIPRRTPRPGMRDIDQFELLGRAGQSSVGTVGHGGSSLTRGDAQGLGRLASFLGPNNVGANMRSAGQGFANMASSAAGAASNQQSDALRALLSALQGKQEGGVIQGPSVPPDTVPILAQGGEGVIPVKLMHELENDKSGNPLIRKLQKVMGKEPGPSMSAIQRKQRGGKIAKVMGEFKAGKLMSSSGEAVKDRKQALAIALSMAAEPEKMQRGGFVGGLRGGFGGATSAEEDERPLASEVLQQLIDAATLGPLRRSAGEAIGRAGEAVEESLPFRFAAPPPEASAISPETPALPPSLPPEPSVGFEGEGNRGNQFVGGLESLPPPQAPEPPTISRGGQALGVGELGGASTRFGTPTQSGQAGGFSVSGAAPDPVANDRRAFELARARTTMLQALATTATRGQMERLAPEIGRARDAETLAGKQLQASEQQAALEAQQQMLNEQRMAQTAADMATSAGEQATDVEVARLRKEGQIGAAEARNPLGDLGAQGQVEPPAELVELLGVQDPQEFVSALSVLQQEVDFTSLASTPQNLELAGELVIRLAEMGVTPEQIRQNFPTLAAFSEQQQ